jgi:hypothetical protein
VYINQTASISKQNFHRQIFSCFSYYYKSISIIFVDDLITVAYDAGSFDN